MWAVIALINASLASGIYSFGKYCLIGREEEFASWRIANKLEVVKKDKRRRKRRKILGSHCRCKWQCRY